MDGILLSHFVLPYIPKTLNLFQTIGYLPFGDYEKPFHGADVRLLMERFEKDSFINRTEAESLAEMLSVQPERVLRWFYRHRRKGSLQTVEREAKVITLI